MTTPPRLPSFVLVLALLAAALLPALRSAEGQPTPGPVARSAAPEPASTSSEVEKVVLGESTHELTGPWRFQAGDDPRWSAKTFDDAAWEKVELAPDPADPSGEVPGWTARGHAGYAGFAWYRLRVDVEGAKHTLALKMPDSADDAYQIFVNGTMIGEFGKFKQEKVVAYGSVPRSFRLPKEIRNGEMTIAVRMWMDSATPFNSVDAGGMHGPPMLGDASSVSAQVKLDFDDIAHQVGSGFLEALILFMALLMAATLFWLDPEERSYLYLALVCAVTLLGNLVVLLANFTTPVGQTTGVILQNVLATPIRIGFWVMFWGWWFRVSRSMKLERYLVPLVLVLIVCTAMLRPPLFGETVPVAWARTLVPLQQISKLCLGVLLLVVAVLGFKRRKAEGWLAAIALLLAIAANFQHELRLIHVSLTSSIFGFIITLGQSSTILSLLIITIMLMRRFVYSQRRQEQWKLEIEQAQNLQQILIPEVLPKIEGLEIESEYRPAREVGGDFFQIIPLPGSDVVFIVVGDVTGKGLQAGMLVALIVGALRTAVQHSHEPAVLLAAVNDQLCERGHASATCMVLRMERSGCVNLSHAGHLPPYLNGVEMEMEGALPLGTIGGIEFPSIAFQLNAGDALMMMSDGIVEAQNSHGQIFGFERVEQMLAARSTPTQIAAAAQRFGQEDDILVLQVRWTGAAVRVLEAEPVLTA